MAVSDEDLDYLRRCVGRARTAIDGGDDPFGSPLTDESGNVLFADRNRVLTDGPAPELEDEMRALYEAKFRS